MARHDLSGAVDFTVLERMTGGDDGVTEEVLGLFVEQAAMWSTMLDPREDGWRDAVHTIRGTALGVGAEALAVVCAEVEMADQALAHAGLERVRTALDAALADVAAYRHEIMLRGLRA
ncbi:MAG: Hpt domain-containing protein [Brevundimonas sp.]|uniref:Hpt domain-containing protein n=1 Tax=Brevundimonas sp. TaxID=1871086 RepID=UPI0012150CA4|nr:Hpt domain-containing protein [Brevundimonas sp.]RZJ19030.1 MAG: Hpt domain-containing protein [Brevundimonas sp.]